MSIDCRLMPVLACDRSRERSRLANTTGTYPATKSSAAGKDLGVAPKTGSDSTISSFTSHGILEVQLANPPGSIGLDPFGGQPNRTPARRVSGSRRPPAHHPGHSPANLRREAIAPLDHSRCWLPPWATEILDLCRRTGHGAALEIGAFIAERHTAANPVAPQSWQPQLESMHVRKEANQPSGTYVARAIKGCFEIRHHGRSTWETD